MEPWFGVVVLHGIGLRYLALDSLMTECFVLLTVLDGRPVDAVVAVVRGVDLHEGLVSRNSLWCAIDIDVSPRPLVVVRPCLVNR